jgi:eukaryotic-like serine/threonine-protein kinase
MPFSAFRAEPYRSKEFTSMDSQNIRAVAASGLGTLQETDAKGAAVSTPCFYPSDPEFARPGAQLDFYRIETIVARTTTTLILRGTDLRTGGKVAIKIPHAEVEGDLVFFSRFQREQEIGKRLNHPGIPKAIVDEDRSRLYMVMEWAEGKLLREILHEQGKVPPQRAVRIALGICDSLDYIHSHGIVHRDLKPENIIVDAEDRTKLIDFGIAGQWGARRLTFGKFSQVLGTPDYISPEQVKGKRGDARSDVYALGIMLYEMLAGQVPFTGSNPFVIMNNRVVGNAVPLREIDTRIQPALEEIVRRAMERDPMDRYSSARDLAHDLEHQDEVRIPEAAELRERTQRRAPWTRKLLSYVQSWR